MTGILSWIVDTGTNIWNWAVGLSSSMQIALVLLMMFISGGCAIVSKRLQNPTYTPTNLSGSSLTAAVIALYTVSVVCTLVALLTLVAVFAPLVGLA